MVEDEFAAMQRQGLNTDSGQKQQAMDPGADFDSLDMGGPINITSNNVVDYQRQAGTATASQSSTLAKPTPISSVNT